MFYVSLNIFYITHFCCQQFAVLMLEYMQYRFDITRDGQFQVIELLG